MKKSEIKFLTGRLIPGIIFTGILFFMISCAGTTGESESLISSMPPEPDPEGYVCYRAAGVLTIDGLMNESDWESAPWTDYFVDIEGDKKPLPAYKTRLKMLWDHEYLYVAASLEEPHVWATLRQRDTVIFYDNDFEVFIDPDGDTHNYYELEVNAFGTPWDLLLIKPYRDGGPAVINWDINGLKVATDIDGTINDTGDTDKGWSVEIAIPFQVLKECNKGSGLPEAGHQWRINFSRVEWRTVIENGKYKKEINPESGKPFPEYNWVWSPQGRINMHMPEMWGYLQFSDIKAGSGNEIFIADKELKKKWALRMIYYAENEFFREFKSYTPEIKLLGLGKEDFTGLTALPVIKATGSTFESYFTDHSGKSGWTIYHDGMIIDRGAE